MGGQCGIDFYQIAQTWAYDTPNDVISVGSKRDAHLWLRVCVCGRAIDINIMDVCTKAAIAGGRSECNIRTFKRMAEHAGLAVTLYDSYLGYGPRQHSHSWLHVSSRLLNKICFLSETYMCLRNGAYYSTRGGLGLSVGFHAFMQSPEADVRIVPQSGHDHFFPRPFLFI
jgi:hypothetical protein